MVSVPAARQDLITSILILIMAVVLMMTLRGTTPRAVIVPYATLSILIVLSVALLLRSLLRLRQGRGEMVKPMILHKWHFLYASLAFIGYATTLKMLGFYTASALFLAVLIPALGYRRILPLILVVIGFLLNFWLIFEVLFGRTLPQEFFEPFLSANTIVHG